MYGDCDKQIIAGISNSSKPGKVEIYSDIKSDLFFFHQTYQWLMTF